MPANEDTYWCIAEPAAGEYRDRGSRFIAYAYPVHTGAEIRAVLDTLRKEHHKAHHHCYAYRLGASGNLYRINDDGEPSGTAGKPILGQIDSFGLCNVLVVVVRYFGGIKLGTSGLIQAYRAAARAALEGAGRIERLVELPMQIEFDYALMSQVMALLKSETDLRLLLQQFEEKAKIQFVVRLGKAAELERKLLECKGLELKKMEDLPFGG